MGRFDHALAFYFFHLGVNNRHGRVPRAVSLLYRLIDLQLDVVLIRSVPGDSQTSGVQLLQSVFLFGGQS